jgi:deoxyribonuclease-1
MMHRYLILAIAAVFAASAGADHVPAQHGVRVLDYQHALPLVWGTLYRNGGETLYCARRFGTDKGRAINVEHVFPMAWVGRHLKCGRRQQCRETNARFNLIEADLHNLWPARADVNKARSAHPFALIEGERRAFEGCDFEVDERRRTVEPRPQARGEIARSMFYMADEYALAIYPRHGKLLQAWNRDDAVSNEERRRNDLIERIQGNRNKYIDTPELAEALRF